MKKTPINKETLILDMRFYMTAPSTSGFATHEAVELDNPLDRDLEPLLAATNPPPSWLCQDY